MGEYAITMPDIGEGIAEAELIEWLVAVGDEVAADAPLAEVTTDKARVQIPSPVAGTVQRLGAEPGDLVAVGAELIRLEVAGRTSAGPDGAAHGAQEQGEKADGAEPQGGQIDGAEARVVQTQVMEDAEWQEASEAVDSGVGQAPRLRNGPKVLAAPAVRGRARDAGVSLASVPVTGPGARVTAADLETYLRTPAGRLGAVSAGRPGMGVDRARDAAGPRSRDGVTEIPLRGIRRVISQRLQQTWHEVPHITIVEEVDVTELEDLRARLNEDRGGKGAGRGGGARPRLTVLPFLIRAIVRAVAEQPELNAHMDAQAEVSRQFDGVDVGLATQAPDGLKVPVIRGAEGLDLWETATRIEELSTAVRDGRARPEELTGSTITVTSLGKLGALASTPIVNSPEVAIVGVNRMVVRPLWDGSGFVPRTVMNLSSSFDHRAIDGWEAATFVARLKELLETPALLFVG